MKDRVTVIIPVYNRASIVGRTLDSLVEQTYRPLDVVLVDNNSTDSTLDVLRRWADANYADDFAIKVVQETAPGAAAARNKGLDEARTLWTMFFDSDDIMLPDHIERAMSAAMKNPGADIVGWNVKYVFADGRERVMRFFRRHHLFHCIHNGMMATQRYMAKTDLFHRAGGWDASALIWNDTELGTRLLALNPVIVHAGSDITVKVMCSEASITGNDYSHNHNKIDHTYSLFMANVPPRAGVLVTLSKAIIAANYKREDNPDLARGLFSEAMSETASIYHRALLTFAYHYTAAGLRGAARILRPFVNYR